MKHLIGFLLGMATITATATKAAEKPAVVLVHGWWDSISKFDTMKEQLELKGFTCYVPTLTPNDARNGLEPLAESLKLFITREIPAERPMAVVGFSMGAIVARYYAQELGGAERIQTLCTLSAPHQGTWFGYLWFGLGAKQMRPGSKFLKSLAKTEDELESVAVHNWWTPMDLMIFPPMNSRWPGRASNKVHVIAHPLMVYDSRVINGVVNAILGGEKTSP